MTVVSQITRQFCEIRPVGGFDFIMADPPWRFATRSPKGITKKIADSHYDTMTIDDIRALQIGDALAAENCLLWLWATNPMLPQAMDTLKSWGFTFTTAGHWSKRTKHGKQAFGTGYVLRCAGEPFLIGKRGNVRTSRSVRSVIEGPIREHSRKPDEAFAAAEKLMPDARRIEVFGRQSRPGWTVFGNQSEKFDTAGGADQ